MRREEDDKTLLSVLEKNKGVTVCIGAKSSFFFIGPADEAIRDLPIMGAIIDSERALSGCRRRRGKSEPRDLSCRRVVSTYYRDDKPNSELAIIVEGDEFGSVWTRAEYLSVRKNLGPVAQSVRAGHS